MTSKSVIASAGLATESCPRCGSKSRVSGNLCLKCLLYCGLGEETSDDETLEDVLDQTDVRDADWKLGNYQILEEIGRGGMGVIYRARQRHSRRIVALKRILAHHADSHDTLVRFRREAEAAASLDHPHILPIYEVSESDEGLPFFSMKFAAGGSLLGSQAGLRDQPRHAVNLMAKVSRAVEYAHNHGILHRDLKPGNILLDGRGEPMVSDFGLAKWLDDSSDLTRTLTVFGTPGYIAPEQAHGAASFLKPTADVYSLGAMLFDLLAGRAPFLGEHALSVIEQAKENPAPKLRSIVPKIPRDLETICARCLERDPTARYQSAAELAEDLERWTDGRPVVARPVPPATRVWRWAKRNPKLASSVAGCALAGVTALAFVTFTFLPNTSPFRPLLAISEKSIAVLPFENLSDDKQNSYFADGVQDEILTDLARVADLKVISRTSVMQYKTGAARNLREIARALGVAKIVEGSVQRSGNRIRIVAQLIDAQTDHQVWAQRYDRELADVFTIQSELANAIADQLRAKISPAEKVAIDKPPTSDLSAFELYEEAKTLWGDVSDVSHAVEKLPEAARLLDEAVTRDPQFLQAWCLLSRTHGAIYRLGDHTQSRLDLAKSAVDRALRIQPGAGEAHLALAIYYYFGFLDYRRAREELELARRTLPNNAEIFLYAGLMGRREGRWDEATYNLKRALELNPRDLFLLQQFAIGCLAQRNYLEATQTLERILTIVPGDPVNRVRRALVEFRAKADIKPYRMVLAELLAENQKIGSSLDSPELALCERSAAAAARALANYPHEGVTTWGVNVPHEYWEGVFARFQGDLDNARAKFTAARRQVETATRGQAENPTAISLLGTIDAALGRKKEALEEGRRACQLMPLSKDAVHAQELAVDLARIYAWTGEKDLAIEQIAAIERSPNELSYGLLKLHPDWDSLRRDPRFERILSDLALK